MSILCLFGHRRRTYVGVADVRDVWASLAGKPCVHGMQFVQHCDVCYRSAQVARWVCDCGAMGEQFIRRGRGIFKVHMGDLVPDEKRWSNPNPEEAR